MKNRNLLSALLILGVLCLHMLPLQAQRVDVPVDGQRIFKTVEYMAADRYLGRKPNTPEFFELQDWVVKQYEAWGLEPAGENGTFFQAVPIAREYAVTYGMPKLIINGREFFARFGDFTIDTRSTSGKTIKGGIVFAGYGISAPDKGLDEYAGLDVDGKIVLILKGNPDDFDPPRMRLGPPTGGATPEEDAKEDWETESADSTKIMAAYDKGAAGILIYNPEPEETASRMFRRFRPRVEASPFKRDFLVLSEVSDRVFQWILWTDPQVSSRGFTNWLNGVRTDIQKKKARSLDTRLKAEIRGYEKTLLKGESFNDNQGRNVIAKITGNDPGLKDELVIIGAHFDHLGVTNGQIYNGAEDNASGSAVVMEVARLMKTHGIRNRRTVIFCLWTAEELGLVGSRYWVETPSDGVTIDNVVAYFNMDMVGLGDEIDAPGALNFPSIWEVIKRDQDPDIMDAVKPSEGGPGGSDHSGFIELGIEALALMTGGEGGHPDYHDTGDDVEKLNPEILGKTARFVLQGTVNLGNETAVNLLIPDREHMFNGLNWSLKVIDPGLGIRDSWTHLEAKEAKDLVNLMTRRIEELKQPRQAGGDPFAAMRRRFRQTSLQTGIPGPEAFKHDLHLMQIAKQILEFGRIDIDGDDGVWFNQGITAEGVDALKAMEKNQIILHLMNPQKATLTAVLEKAGKPFLFSGFSEPDDSMIVQINEKKVLMGVDFDPENTEETVSKLLHYKEKIGDTDNLILNVTAEVGLKEAKKVLYQRLIQAGWEKREIYAIGGVGTQRGSNGNLDVLPGARRRFPRR